MTQLNIYKYKCTYILGNKTKIIGIIKQIKYTFLPNVLQPTVATLWSKGKRGILPWGKYTTNLNNVDYNIKTLFYEAKLKKKKIHVFTNLFEQFFADFFTNIYENILSIDLKCVSVYAHGC